jgi:hypothetical protein
MARTSEEDPDVQLGRNLAAAFIATNHGIGLDYTRKKYAGKPVPNIGSHSPARLHQT